MYIATFFTHYGAQTFHRAIKAEDASAKLMPVPRALSAACGICVAYQIDVTERLKERNPEDIEGIYSYDGSHYETLFEVQE